LWTTSDIRGSRLRWQRANTGGSTITPLYFGGLLSEGGGGLVVEFGSAGGGVVDESGGVVVPAGGGVALSAGGGVVVED
jgi:hypothetical protein